jgi:A/G-specific adenine glycosylase
MMDLGATVCTRGRPACERCPLQQGCLAFAAGEPAAYPGSRPRREQPRREVFMLLLEKDGALLLERRPPAGIWGGLWSFPECEPGDSWQAFCSARYGLRADEHAQWEAVTHTFSHFQLRITPVHAKVSALASHGTMEGGDTLWYNTDTPLVRGLAAPIERLLAQWSEGR